MSVPNQTAIFLSETIAFGKMITLRQGYHDTCNAIGQGARLHCLLFGLNAFPEFFKDFSFHLKKNTIRIVAPTYTEHYNLNKFNYTPSKDASTNVLPFLGKVFFEKKYIL